ncbi:MAG: discoidin domain-containing protein [Sedimentisphaerales bacterium]|nr:discoidin domain-containing protein [Sedimentisphaerales bacterium]
MYRRLVYLACLVVIFNLSNVYVFGAQDPSLVGWWKLDEGSGEIAYDSSGNAYDGTINGNPEWVFGIDAQALEFDGIDDYIVVDRMVGTDFTLMAWIKTSLPGDAAVGDYPATGGDGLFFAGVLGGATNNDFILALVDTELMFGAGNNSVGPTEQSVVTGDWVHIALTRSVDSGDVSIFIDGVLDTTGALENTNPLTQNPSITLGANTIHLHYYTGLMDDIRIYERALAPEEIRIIVGDVISYSSLPQPANGSTYVPKDVVLSWKPGEFADKHDVYFGTVLEDVNNADRTNQLGVLAVRDHDANTYDPGVLEYGQKYYWRIDEVNSPPDLTIFKGGVWNFTLEPFLHQIPGENITVTASSQTEGQGPENTVNNSGMIDGLHSNSTSGMWVSEPGDPGTAWIQYDFDKVYELHEMNVWNYNGPLFLTGYGFKDVTVEYSPDGETWEILEGVPEFTKATGKNNYAADTIVDFGGILIKSVRITANSNWGISTFNKYGLSEVVFLVMPFGARSPEPKNGARNAALDTTLSWITGRQAAQHKLYFSSDEQAVINGTVNVITANQTKYGPLSLNPGKVYYWRVDEVNNAETPSIWAGSIWSFSTQEYLVLDDFESYNDIPLGEEGSDLVYMTWVDGYDSPSTNGSTMGYVQGSSLDSEIFHRGEKSVPLFYNNTTAQVSEVTASTDDLGISRDWSAISPDTLSFWFYGDPNNALTEQMYVKLNNAKVSYDGDPNNLLRQTWQQWDIDISEFNVGLNNITEITIGFERTQAAGGSGKILIDDIQLYAFLDDQAILEE